MIGSRVADAPLRSNDATAENRRGVDLPIVPAGVQERKRKDETIEATVSCSGWKWEGRK
jgi:hypothetical protein